MWTKITTYKMANLVGETSLKKQISEYSNVSVLCMYECMYAPSLNFKY